MTLYIFLHALFLTIEQLSLHKLIKIGINIQWTVSILNKFDKIPIYSHKTNQNLHFLSLLNIIYAYSNAYYSHYSYFKCFKTWQNTFNVFYHTFTVVCLPIFK